MLPPVGLSARGSEPACAGLDGPKSRCLWQRLVGSATRSARDLGASLISSRLLRIDAALELRNPVAQREAALFEAAQQQFILRPRIDQPVDGGVEVGVFDAKLD